MTTSNRVVWYEGMFLQPQHFQQHDRHIETLINQKHQVLDGNAWGFTSLQLDLELLNVGKIGINNAAGVFPDGTYFNMPGTDHVSQPFVIPEGMSDTILYLALPLRQQGEVEVGNVSTSSTCRHTAFSQTIKDATEGHLEETDIQLGSLACRIVSEHEDLSAYTYLPIARVRESRSNHQITLDKGFLTTFMDAHEMLSLGKFITEVHGLLNHRAEMLASRLTDTQQAGTAEIVDFMLLQLVNKYELIFHYFMHKKPLHPEQLYITLTQLMADMMTYTSNKRRPIQPPVYRHDDLFATFKPIIQEIRHALSMVLEQNATAITLEDRSNGLWVGEVHDKNLFESSEFILAAYADMPLDNLRSLFMQQVKIAPVEHIATLVKRGLPGVPLAPVGLVPRQIPYHANFVYFSIDKRHELWQYMDKSGGIAFHITGHVPGIKLELWAIKG